MPRQITNFHERENLYTIAIEIGPERVDNVLFQQRGAVVNIVGILVGDDGQQQKFNISQLRIPDDANIENTHVESNNHVLVLDIPRGDHEFSEDGKIFGSQTVDGRLSDEDDVHDVGEERDEDSREFIIRYMNDGELSEAVIVGNSAENARELFVSVSPDGVSEDDIEAVISMDDETDVAGDTDDTGDTDVADDDENSDEDDDDDGGVGGADKIVK